MRRLLVVMGFLAMLAPGSARCQTVMPNLVGMQQDAAASALFGGGVESINILNWYGAGGVAGQVMQQNPIPGSTSSYATLWVWAGAYDNITAAADGLYYLGVAVAASLALIGGIKCGRG